MIIIDTREQKPLWDPAIYNVIQKKLDEGDYTTEKLYGKAHIERKSGIDLYGSIIQGHVRFRNEIKRALEKNIKFAIFVECSESDFFGKKFKGGYRLKVPSGILRKIISTMIEKYFLEIVWCDGRDDMMDKMCLWFARSEYEINGDNTILLNNSKELKEIRKEMVKFK